MQRWHSLYLTLARTASNIYIAHPSPYRRIMSSSSVSPPTSWPTTAYIPSSPTTWPHKPGDFARHDAHDDEDFYAAPRFVTHIDDAAIANLRAYYAAELPSRGRILDFCTSHLSHFPPSLEAAAKQGQLKVLGLGMNAAELAANPALQTSPLLQQQSGARWVAWNLNRDPAIATALRTAQRNHGSASLLASDERLDAATNVVSIDYLTQPVKVLASLRSIMQPGGKVHLTVSNRCFPTKAIARWLTIGEQQRLHMVGDYLHFAGWKDIEIVELSNGESSVGGDGMMPGTLQSLLSSIGMQGRRDPLWVVRGTNRD